MERRYPFFVFAYVQASIELGIGSDDRRGSLGMNEHVTLVHPDARDPAARAISSGFPVDLLNQSAGRLRVLALLYAFVFFMAGIFPALLFSEDRARFLGSFLQWGPSVLGIGVALLVAAVIRSPRLPLPTAMNIGLAFEIVSSYAIAAAEFADPMGLEMHGGHVGLSWVAVWVVLFTVVVPTAPRRALLAALASVSSVPVVIGFIMVSGATSLRLDPGQFFFGLVFPYLLVVGMAYVGARVVYYLGTEVKRARELGSYRLEEKLGEGGMGEVWRARHRMLARPAAIKLIRPSFARDGRGGLSEEAVRRLEREAQVIARLRSPHTVELFDFGMAADGAFYYTNPLHTRENAVQGTPAFIAPEQAMGTDVDGRVDIYATGCLDYWLLTGQFVFSAETPMGLLVQHAQTPPVPPSARMDQPIPTALDDLVLSCLAKDPVHRPQSARELSLRLAEVEGASAWTQDRAREWWASHQLATAVTFDS